MNKKIAAFGLAAGLAGGSAAGLALTGSSGLASAQDSTTATTVVSNQSSNSTASDTARPDPSAKLSETLKPLVADGTLTQDQADKVIAALKAAGPVGGPGGPGGHGGGGRMGGPGLDAAATAIGISATDLQTALQGGQTIAQVAESKGVAVSTVVTAMLDSFKTHLAQEVADGTHTQAEADAKLADAETRITERVNSNTPQGGPQGAPPAAPAASTSTTTQG
jgi:hypothetical protein